MAKYLIVLTISSFLLGCNSEQKAVSYQSETLEIHQVADHVYWHLSFLNTESFGKVGCNGMVVVDQNEAIIFDTPTDDASTSELIDWVENELGCEIKAIIPTHFHADCLAGLNVFHQRNIPSYASERTIALAKTQGKTIPENPFTDLLTLPLGSTEVLIDFVGEGHTTDNVIGYFPSEKALFGGCLVKEVDAGKGNLEDANIGAWPVTISRLKAKYPDTQIVIPGHGQPGGTELLDYTIQLFTSE